MGTAFSTLAFACWTDNKIEMSLKKGDYRHDDRTALAFSWSIGAINQRDLQLHYQDGSERLLRVGPYTPEFSSKVHTQSHRLKLAEGARFTIVAQILGMRVMSAVQGSQRQSQKRWFTQAASERTALLIRHNNVCNETEISPSTLDVVKSQRFWISFKVNLFLAVAGERYSHPLSLARF